MKPTSVGISVLTLFLGLAVIPGSASAGSAGSRLGIEDITLGARSIKAETFLPPLEINACEGNPRGNEHKPDLRCTRPFQSPAIDAAGSFYFVISENTSQLDATSTIWRTTASGLTQKVAFIMRRASDDGRVDKADFTGLSVDLVRGYLYATLWTGCEEIAQTPCSYVPAVAVVRFVGFDSLRGVGQSQNHE